jgi:GH15 family glucan-1,4-alpha-glucosidase
MDRPFVFTEANRGETLPIGAHGIIGDGFSSALVRVDGAIDWLCMPRFDSPSVFASILDRDTGGETAITPVQRPFEVLQRYDPDTNVLETLFRVEGQGVVRLTDFMPWSDDPRLSIHEVHRRIECIEGEVELAVVFNPRFDYGATEPTLGRQEHGIRAQGNGNASLSAAFDAQVPWSDRAGGGVETRLKLRAGERRWMVLSWGSPHVEPVAAYRSFELLRATRHRWREWSRLLHYDGPWRHHVLRSALVLKSLIYAPTGGMVAAPTTSLPEWVGGTRNWDYRYVWARDGAMGVRACNLIGYKSEARDFFHFVRDALDHGAGLDVMYSIDGGPAPAECELAHLSGFRGSGPVRIGNDARLQTQLDTAGALLDAAFLYEKSGWSITLRAWRHLVTVVETVAAQWHKPDHGIWEPRDGKRHNVHSKLMSWLALDRASRLALLFGDNAAHHRWATTAGQVHADLCANGLDAAGKRFTMAYDLDVPDAALLLMPIHGLLDPQDPRMLATMDWVRAELGSGPFLYRYRVDDGVGGDEGAFVLCGFWLAEALAMAGRIEEAQAVFVAHAEASNHLGLLAEEIDPTTGTLLGNFPQAFSHLGLINAAARIDLALRMRDEGSHRTPQFGVEQTDRRVGAARLGHRVEFDLDVGGRSLARDHRMAAHG